MSLCHAEYQVGASGRYSLISPIGISVLQSFGLIVLRLCAQAFHLRTCRTVVVAVALQQVDGSPDAETGTQCDDKSLKNGYCAVEKCHKCVPPCTMCPCGLMNSDFPSACAPANGQTYSQVSNPNQKPGYVKRRQLAAPYLILLPAAYP